MIVSPVTTPLYSRMVWPSIDGVVVSIIIFTCLSLKDMTKVVIKSERCCIKMVKFLAVCMTDDVHATLNDIGFTAITVVITLNNRDCFIGNINDTICLAFEYLPITVIVVTGCRLIKSTIYILQI